MHRHREPGWRRPSAGATSSPPGAVLLIGPSRSSSRRVGARSSAQFQHVAGPQAPALEGAGLSLDDRAAAAAGAAVMRSGGTRAVSRTTRSRSQKATSMGNRIPTVCTDRVPGRTMAPS